jgi:DNA-binding FrmR family transcriptional regulator
MVTIIPVVDGLVFPMRPFLAERAQKSDDPVDVFSIYPMGVYGIYCECISFHAQSTNTGEGAMQGYTGDREKILTRIRRIEGQVHAIGQMVEDDQYCIDVLTQISASTSALKSVALLLLDDHLNHCVRRASQEGGEVADEKMREASQAIARLVKS